MRLSLMLTVPSINSNLSKIPSVASICPTVTKIHHLRRRAPCSYLPDFEQAPGAHTSLQSEHI